MLSKAFLRPYIGILRNRKYGHGESQLIVVPNVYVLCFKKKKIYIYIYIVGLFPEAAIWGCAEAQCESVSCLVVSNFLQFRGL